MAVFTYRAAGDGGHIEQGVLTADSARDARDELRSRGLAILQVARHAQGRDNKWVRVRPGSRCRTKLATAIRELATLLAVGIPLLEALDVVVRQASGAFRTSLMTLRDQVAAGTNLAEAMALQPEIFDELTCHMVEVGENAGNLEAVLSQLAEFKERSLNLQDRVLTALTYPALLVVASVAVTIFLMTFVVPMLLDNLTAAGRALPWPTRILRAVSELLAGHWLAILVVAGGFTALVLALLRTETGRRRWHRCLLQIPVLGDVILKQTLSRMSMIVSTLLRSGIEFIPAVQLASKSMNNLVLSEAFAVCSKGISAGQDIGAAMERMSVLPPLVVQVFAVGQQTGRLEEMLDQLAESYDRQVGVVTARLTALLEPALIVLLSVVIGFILFATILPILEAGNVL